MSNTSGTGKDLRVVELVKASAKKPLKYQLSAGKNPFICLGHFDCLRVRKLKVDGNTLKTIEADLQRKRDIGNNYVYPLYLLHYPDNLYDLDSFWDMRSCCMAISRVHFISFQAKEPNIGTSQHIDKLKDSIRKLSKESPTPSEELGELSIVVEGELVHCVFYHTLELGDVVVGLKSNSLNSCLKVMQRILETASVGDVYSYCGIHSTFKEKKRNRKKDAEFGVWDGKKKSRRTVNDFYNEELSSASIRFSVRSVRCAEMFWKMLPDRKALQFVVGTADSLYNFKKCRLEEFIDYIRLLLMNTFEERVGGHLRQFTMYDAFDDVISRVGVSYDNISSEVRPLSELKEVKQFSALQESLRRKLEKLQSHKDRLWFSALTAQTNTLLTMMDNCVTDDLTILLWPSLSALLERIGSCSDIGMRQDTDIQKFLNAWNILEGDILRLEGQLVQNPELQFSRYYTPAALMVFYMALLQQYNTLLRDINLDPNSKRFVPLITYDITHRAHTLCILDDRIQPSNTEEYQGNIPLLVSLPPTLMYQPFDVAIILCHETAHYTGDKTRQRSFRLNQIVKSCAGAIAEAWSLDGREAYPLRDGCSVEILHKIYIELRSCYDEQNKGIKNCGKMFIHQISQTMPKAVQEVFFNRGLQSQLAATCLENETIRQSFITYAKQFSPKAQSSKMQELNKHLQDNLILYRECYADLTAILCLGLEKETYLECMFFWEYTLIQKDLSKDPSKLERLYFQAALVLDAIKSVRYEKNIYGEHQEERSIFLKEWLEKIGYYQECINQEIDVWTHEEEKKRLALHSECVCLKDYLHSCAEEISKRLQDSTLEGKRKDIQSLLEIIANEPDFRKLHGEIAKYKESLLKEP